MKHVFSSKYLIWILIAVGLLLRIDHYIDNRALWVDEAWRALDVTRHSFGEFLYGSYFAVPSPIGFVFLTKISVFILGNNEYAFRLIPLLSGIFSLFLFTKLLKNTAGTEAIPISLGFFVFCNTLIYYAAENKQFSSDVFLTLLVYIAAFSAQSKEKKPFHIGLFGLIGAIAVWVSWPILFVLTSIAIYDFSSLIIKERKTDFTKTVLKHSLWILSFISVYFLSLSKKGGVKGLSSMWNGAFWPTPLFSLESLQWLSSSMWKLFKDPIGLTYPFLGIIAFWIGVYLVTKRNKFTSFILFFPIIIVLLASAFKLYPFSGRALLFLSPAIFFFVGEGLGSIIRKNRFSHLLCAAILLTMFYHPVTKASAHLVKQRQREEIRPLMQFLKKQQKEGDYLYLTSGTQYAYRYYFNYYKFDNACKIVGITSDYMGVDDLGHFLYVYFPYEGVDGKLYGNGTLLPGKVNIDKFSLNHLVGQRRTWILFSHYRKNTKDYFIKHLNAVGNRLMELHSVDSSLYLYDLSSSEDPLNHEMNFNEDM